ncbi:MAG: nitric oxide synthase oxygenase, partial [Chloroflexi bacterium]
MRFKGIENKGIEFKGFGTFRKGFEAFCKGFEKDSPVQPQTQPLPPLLQKCTRFTDLTAEQKVLWEEASEYLHLFCIEQECAEYYPSRLTEIQTEILQTGTYRQSEAELIYGAKVAWRNSTRCIGRLHWKMLQVRDLRNLSTAEEIFDALLDHLRLATNDGKIRPMISIFAPAHPGSAGPRIWNPQLIRYAGYQQPDGTVIGDPAQVELTKAIQRLGWQGGPGTPFDLLPIVIQAPDQEAKYFQLPPEVVLEVPLSHPHYPWFSELDLKWHALPVVSNMRLESGGIAYTAAPFNGWYMETEIGARNLGDVDRYNLLPVIAQQMGLNMRSDRTLWKDHALV